MELFGEYPDDESFLINVQSYLDLFKHKEIIIYGAGKLISTLLQYHKCADHSCTVSYDGKIYPCTPVSYANYNNLYTSSNQENRDYVSINETKLSIVRFFTRSTKYANPTLCDMCYGLGPLVNNRLVEAGKQVK